MRHLLLFSGLILLLACAYTSVPETSYDIVIRNGSIYDGTGGQPFPGDIAIQGDTIVAIGDLQGATGKKEIDAKGLAVAPGFINMLSWADKDLLKDGRSMSDIKQGVTLEVFGEGWSPGPIHRKVKVKTDSLWTTLDGYFRWLQKKGVSPNVASFVGHTSVRSCVMNMDNRKPTATELGQMKYLVEQAMQEGAMGLGTSLIYAPATYATTEELIELSKVAAHYGGMYTTHMRSEGDFMTRALNETFRISREAGIHAEIYHIKLSISRNWNKVDTVIAKIDSARRAGLKITANLYPYTGSGTGLTSRLPNWVQEGGGKEMRKRLRNPALRKKVLYEMEMGIPYKNSEPRNVMIMGFRLDSLNKLYKGKRLDEIARLHGKNADETVIDLIVRDKSRIETLYFLISEDNIKRFLKLPYVSFGSDAGSQETPPDSLDIGAHPRTYGTFARVLGKYVHDEKIISLQDAVRKLTLLPATNLKLKKRGQLKAGYFADLAIFDADKIRDHATFEDPHHYATGMVHVLVNGKLVLENGQHTGAKPGKIIRGPGWKKKP